MAGSSKTSGFIPKRGPVKREPKRRVRKNQIFVFSIITYSVLFATLVAAGATFVYQRVQQNILQQEVAALTSLISDFSTEDLAQVYDLDITLTRASDRVHAAASVALILDELAQTIAQPVQIQDLSIERRLDSGFAVTGNFLTQSFDAALFQRQLLQSERELFSSVTISDVSLATASEEQSNQPAQNTGGVTFSAELIVPIDSVSYNPQVSLAPPRPGLFTSQDLSASRQITNFNL